MNTLHKELLSEIVENSNGYSKEGFTYVGTKRPFYHISVPTLRKIVKRFLRTHSSLTQEEYTKLITSLYNGKSFTERTIPGYLLQDLPHFRKKLDPKLLDVWIPQLSGWCEIDSTCQSAFTAEEMLSNWSTWKKLLTDFSKSNKISKRRASVVLLNKVVEKSTDKRLATAAFSNIDRIKSERDILITKAVSWILRSLIKNHRDRVVAYLDENGEDLPKIAIRETTNKLKTGKKT